jgi:type VI secretion system secreted protein Hcp
MAGDEHGSQSLTQQAAGMATSRRDILRGATGLAAAALVGGAIADQGRIAIAAGPNSSITGEISDLGQFQVLSFSWGLSNSGSAQAGGGAGAGKANIQDVSLTKLTDTLTPALFIGIASGKHYSSASLTYSDSKGNPILKLAMEEVMLTSLSLGGSSGGSALTENLTLTFARVTLSYGNASGSWDVAGNVGA